LFFSKTNILAEQSQKQRAFLLVLRYKNIAKLAINPNFPARKNQAKNLHKTTLHQQSTFLTASRSIAEKKDNLLAQKYSIPK
jgi:hypothetical protein